MVKTNAYLSADSNIAIKGYDPVSYSLGSPTQGKANITSAYGGAIFQFSTEENKTKFEADPDLYMPQYGGWCAVGVAEGKQVDIDPTTFVIVDNKLYLFANTETKATWEADQVTHIQNADAQWAKGELVAS